MSGSLGNAYAIDLPQSALPLMTLSNVIAVIAIVTHGAEPAASARQLLSWPAHVTTRQKFTAAEPGLRTPATLGAGTCMSRSL